MGKVNIFWHRRDLRIDDNAGLYYALNDSEPVLPIFIFDKSILAKLEDKSDSRVTFIHDQILSLSEKYAEQGSCLRVFYSTPHEVFEQLCDEYEIVSVFTNRDYEPYAKKRDSEIESLLVERGTKLLSFKDQVIFEEGEILNDQGAPYKVFTPYKNKWLGKFRGLNLQSYNTFDILGSLLQFDKLEVPSLEEMNFERSKLNIPTPTVKDGVLQEYEAKRNFPAIDATTRIGVHLRFGTISIREKVKQGNQQSEVWLSELIWREFYMMILAHYPNVVDNAFKPKYDQVPWINNEQQFEAWCDGQTGYPIVDAGMRELNATGFMHNRVRMVVASFLTKHLLIDWRWGERYFAEKLLDFELSSNNGGWQWAAGTGTDAQPYFRVFNPQSQQEKFDKKFEYIKQWIPEWGTDDYPEPIVNHKEARERAIKTYKEAIS